MSVQLGRNHDHHFAIPPGGRVRFDAFLKASSYGPFGYVQSALVGFIAGTVLYLAGRAALSSEAVQLNQELPVFLTLALGGPVLAVAFAMIANYLIGRRVQDELELQRQLFGSGAMPPPVSRPDVPGIDLFSDAPRNQ